MENAKKRERWPIEPPDDVKRLVHRAMRDVSTVNFKGLRHTIILNAIREGLKKFARKKDNIA